MCLSHTLNAALEWRFLTGGITLEVGCVGNKALSYLCDCEQLFPNVALLKATLGGSIFYYYCLLLCRWSCGQNPVLFVLYSMDWWSLLPVSPPAMLLGSMLRGYFLTGAVVLLLLSLFSNNTTKPAQEGENHWPTFRVNLLQVLFTREGKVALQ